VALRIGHGFDIHPLVEGRRLVLAGVEVPAEAGLAGHSDADVALHALADALLGAMGLGDLGERFPDSDGAFRDADSAVLVGEVLAAVVERGGRLVSADLTVYLERPKLGPLKQRMRLRLGEITGLDASRIGLKARTFEGFGPIGEGRAAAASAVVLVEVETAARQ
jgi:2-C-methyl-D-erythritol 2,4-cyclodiphosphate synthase